MKPIVICCTDEPDTRWRWIESHLDKSVDFRFIRSSQRLNFRLVNLGRPFAALSSVMMAMKFDASAIVAFGPALTVWCGIISRILGCKSAIQSFAFNFAKLPSGFKRPIFKWALSRVPSIVISSNMERDLYSNVFGLSADQFWFQPWSVGVPKLTNPPIVRGSYVSAIGGNGRDYHILLEAALSLPDIQFCFVVRPGNLDGLRVPSNVKVFVNTPLDDAMNILGHSIFTVVPLETSETPCGHVTIVAAMLLGIAVVATDSIGISDYVRNEETGLTVKPHSSALLSNAIRRLYNDDDLRSVVAKSAERFAKRNCTEPMVAERFYGWLSSLGR